MRNNSTQLIFWTACILLVFHSCKKNDAVYEPPVVVQPPPPPPPTTATFFTNFADSIEKGLDKSQFGYSLSIYSGGQMMVTRSAGHRSRNTDISGDQPFTDTTRIHIASISKTITTMAALKILQEKGIDLSDLVYKYLPAQWTVSESFKTVSFRQLLTHTSGIRFNDGTCNNADVNTFTTLKALVARDINAGKSYCYQNANFGLFRIILPLLKGLVTTGAVTDDINTQAGYESIIREYVLNKASIKTAYAEWVPGNTLLYNFPFNGMGGFNSGNLLPRSGGLGWYLSAQEVGKVISHLSNKDDESILSNNWKDSLILKGYGCFPATTSKGTAYWHDGLWYRTINGEVQGMRGVWIKFPTQNTTAVLLVNALRGPSSNPDIPVPNTGIIQYVINAYNAVSK